jgi:quinol monooxygenase YgiN
MAHRPERHTRQIDRSATRSLSTVAAKRRATTSDGQPLPRRQRSHTVIFIVVKFTIHPDRSDEWLTLVDDFTQATRREPGNVFFEWSRSVDTPNQFVLVEAFESPEAGGLHVNSDHFKTAMTWMPDLITKTPEIINVEVPGDGWSEMGELAPSRRQ